MASLFRVTLLGLFLFCVDTGVRAQGCRFAGSFAAPTTAKTLFLYGEEINRQIPIGADGRFQDSLSFDTPTWILVHTENSYSWLIWLDTGSIDVVFKETVRDEEPNGKRLLSIGHISGPFDTEAREWLVQRYNGLWNQYHNKDSVSVYLRADAEAFINARPSSLLIPRLLSDMATMLTPPQYEALVKYAGGHAGAGMDANAWNAIRRQLEQVKLLRPGADFPSFSMPGVDGKSYQLNAVDADYVLVHFWASWCAPCRVQSPDLKTLFEQTDRAHFQMVHISLDDDRKAWRKAIAQDALPGLHLSELNGWKNTLAQRLLVEAVPFMVLLNRSGQIVAVPRSISELRSIVAGK